MADLEKQDLSPHPGEEDFHAFFLRHFGPLSRFALARSSHHAAEDLVAETFLRAYRAMPQHLLDDDAAARAWLFRVLRNLVVSGARREATARAKMPLLEMEARPVGADSGDREELAGALAKLPERQRTVLELRFVTDLDVATVGNMMGIGEEAVRALTLRALRALRRDLRM